jgi:hypothetical protein
MASLGLFSTCLYMVISASAVPHFEMLESLRRFALCAPSRGANGEYEIGTFRLEDGRDQRLLKLYYFDNQLLCPNHFTLCALYQDMSGKWVESQLLAASGVQFIGVKRIAPDQILLNFSCGVPVELRTGREGFRKSMEELERATQRFTECVHFVNGIPGMRSETQFKVLQK